MNINIKMNKLLEYRLRRRALRIRGNTNSPESRKEIYGEMRKRGWTNKKPETED